MTITYPNPDCATGTITLPIGDGAHGFANVDIPYCGWTLTADAFHGYASDCALVAILSAIWAHVVANCRFMEVDDMSYKSGVA